MGLFKGMKDMKDAVSAAPATTAQVGIRMVEPLVILSV